MNVKRWAILFALAASLLWLVAGCGSQSNFLAQKEPTPTNTRRPRPTFTPRPEQTDTPAVTNTPEAPATQPPTDTPVPPTAKPTVKAAATAKPKPTNPPAQPTAIPPTAAPTTPPYAFRFLSYPQSMCVGEAATCNLQQGVKCENSGWTGLRAMILSAPSADAGISGVKVRFSYAQGGPKIDPDEESGGDGKAEKMLSSKRAMNAGTYYAWVIDSTGKQISPYSPPMTINTKSPEDPQVCEVATVIFVRN